MRDRRPRLRHPIYHHRAIMRLIGIVSSGSGAVSSSVSSPQFEAGQLELDCQPRQTATTAPFGSASSDQSSVRCRAPAQAAALLATLMPRDEPDTSVTKPPLACATRDIRQHVVFLDAPACWLNVREIDLMLCWRYGGRRVSHLRRRIDGDAWRRSGGGWWWRGGRILWCWRTLSSRKDYRYHLPHRDHISRARAVTSDRIPLAGCFDLHRRLVGFDFHQRLRLWSTDIPRRFEPLQAAFLSLAPCPSAGITTRLLPLQIPRSN